MQKNTSQLYDPQKDPQMQKPFIDSDKWETRKGIRFRQIHGGFEGTGVKFLFVFPSPENFEWRFFQYLSPFPGPDEELATLNGPGFEENIAFALSHGAYFIETNMGSKAAFGPGPDATLLYRSSAAAAEYSRKVAMELYGGTRPYGYVYGGSGGGFKTMSCIENTTAFDGAVPFVIGSPVALPHSITVRGHGRRLLRHVLPKIADAQEPGGSGDVYAGLNEEEAAALREVSQFGFAQRAWLQYPYMDDGALPVLMPGIRQADPGYFEDFWIVPGYLGADPNGSARKDRINTEAKVEQIYLPGREEAEAAAAQAPAAVNGVDEAWKKLMQTSTGQPWIMLDNVPQTDYLDGCIIRILTGAAKGQTLSLKALDGKRVFISSGFGMGSVEEVLAQLQPGDRVFLDNSDYIALQTLHRHLVPDRQFTTWDQYRDENGNPLYPQRSQAMKDAYKGGGACAEQNGRINGKVIVVAALEDESALPWQPDWYRGSVSRANPGEEEDIFRLWYIEHANHGDTEQTPDELHLVPYLGALRQALVSVSDWVERKIAPNKTTGYVMDNGQVIPAADASERFGVQPLVTLLAKGKDCINIKAGETVSFEAIVKVPLNGGNVTSIEFSFEGEQDYPVKGEFEKINGGAASKSSHRYEKPGTYFAAARAYSCLAGNEDDIFLQISNLARARIIVE